MRLIRGYIQGVIRTPHTANLSRNAEASATKRKNMQNLWKSFEHYPRKKFPKAETLATPFNDPIAESIEEYQSFLKSLGYAPIAEAAFRKKL